MHEEMAKMCSEQTGSAERNAKSTRCAIYNWLKKQLKTYSDILISGCVFVLLKNRNSSNKGTANLLMPTFSLLL